MQLMEYNDHPRDRKIRKALELEFLRWITVYYNMFSLHGFPTARDFLKTVMGDKKKLCSLIKQAFSQLKL